jgi:hypothetical protein
MRQTMPKKKPMTVAEAGRRGGNKVRDTRGPDFYRELGKKGAAKRWKEKTVEKTEKAK